MLTANHIARACRTLARPTPACPPLHLRRLVIMEAVCYPPYLPDLACSTAQQGPSLEQAYPYGIKSMSRGTTMYDAMSRLGDTFENVPIQGSSPYVKPSSVLFSFDGKKRRWDMVEKMHSVGIVLYHTELQCFLLVRQFRPPLYATRMKEAADAGLTPPCKSAGFTYELCAGLLDKDKSLAQTAKEEILEEVGYDVPLNRLVPLGNSLASAGTSGALHHLFLAVVDESMRASGSGGGLQDHGECIEVLALPLESAPQFVLDATLPKTPGMLFGIMWACNAIKSGQLPGVTSTNAMLTEELTLRPVLPS